MSAPKPLLVGELNPYGSRPDYDLYPRPRGCAGYRLAEIMGLRERDYLRLFSRRNLCRGKWSIVAARAAAREIVLLSEATTLILCGAKVCAAFAIPFAPFTRRRCWWGASTAEGVRVHPTALEPKSKRDVDFSLDVFIIPHPSGRSRLWNVSGAHDRARELLRPLWDRKPHRSG